MLFKIRDGWFGHTPNLNAHFISERGIKWYRGDDYYDTVFFTGGHVREAAEMKCQRKVAIVLEPPAVHEWSYEWFPEHGNDFDWILTFSMDLKKIFPEKCLHFVADSSWIPKSDQRIYQKNKLVSALGSDKYKLGYDIVERFKDKVDCYGNIVWKPIQWKTPAFADYMFTIVTQNCQYDDYWTEKLTDPMTCGTIPLVWGTHNLGKYFNGDGIIYWDTLDELAGIIDWLTPDLYHSKMHAIKENFEKVTKYMVCEDMLIDRYPFLFDDGKPD